MVGKPALHRIPLKRPRVSTRVTQEQEQDHTTIRSTYARNRRFDPFAPATSFSRLDHPMHFLRPLLLAVFITATPLSVAQAIEREEPDIDMYAHISGKCTTLRIAGRDYGCKAVAYFHGQQGRAHFTVVLDDPRDA